MARTYKDQRKFIAKQMIRTALPFCIAKMKSNGQWESLERFASYDDADDRIDYWCDRYPFAFVDIIRVEELNKIAA